MLGLSNLFESLVGCMSNEFDTPKRGGVGLSNLFESGVVCVKIGLSNLFERV